MGTENSKKTSEKIEHYTLPVEKLNRIRNTLSEKKDYTGIMTNPSAILTSDEHTVNSN